MFEEKSEPTKLNGGDHFDGTDERNKPEWFKDIRKFTAVVSNPSVRLHLQAYNQLIKVISNVEELPQPFIKGIVKLFVTSAILHYSHRESFKAVERLLSALAKHDSNATLCTVAHSVLTLFPLTPNISKSIAGLAISPSKWILMYFSYVSDDVVKDLVSSLGHLSFYCCIDSKISSIFEKKLRKLCLDNKQSIRIRNGVFDICKEASCSKKMVCLMSYLFLVNSFDDQDLFLDQYSKSILFSKTRPEDFVLKLCGNGLKCVSAASFHDLLLPNIKKSLLRSPEIAIFGVTKVIESLMFPIDDCFDDLLDWLSSCLKSSSEDMGRAAVNALVAITPKVDESVVEKIVNYLMELLTSVFFFLISV
ncbi:hypothetical protein DICVIV_00604 [Dictyocaulus viviparus]|uniref:Stalled ribosome sensor GCN1-like N-terminal domain-containing protein n=1 Tax=Dictyocaulus viviparus TaxID=29172 RepID=A0A0D8YEN4_DICVI|nr:hypothetical protein DICVIV_00604 [Dictyocaulus viviparus]